MFNFDMVVTVGDETCASLDVDGVLYTVSTCNGAHCCIAQIGSNFRISYQTADGVATDTVIG